MHRRFSWVMALVAIALLAIVGGYGYQLGVARGIAESARFAAPAAGVPVVGWWPHPWGFGFGFFPFFFPFFPLLFILFWFVVIRGLFWRRRSWYGYGGGCGGYRRGFVAEDPDRRGGHRSEYI
jgi:hypothetical protein